MDIPDSAVVVTAVTGFMVYAGLPLAKIVYQHVFGMREVSTQP